MYSGNCRLTFSSDHQEVLPWHVDTRWKICKHPYTRILEKDKYVLIIKVWQIKSSYCCEWLLGHILKPWSGAGFLVTWLMFTSQEQVSVCLKTGRSRVPSIPHLSQNLFKDKSYWFFPENRALLYKLSV